MSEPLMCICDWSGVISDDRKIVYESNMRTNQAFGLPRMSFEEWLPTTTASAIDWFAERGIKRTPDELARAYEEAFSAVYASGMRPSMYSDAPHFLAHATSICPAIVVSAHPQRFLENEALTYGIDHFFLSLYGASRNKIETMQRAIKDLGVNPESCVMIGDTAFDIRAAKAVGTFAIGVTTGYHNRERLEAEKPDIIVSNLTELAEIIKA